MWKRKSNLRYFPSQKTKSTLSRVFFVLWARRIGHELLSTLDPGALVAEPHRLRLSILHGSAFEHFLRFRTVYLVTNH